MRLFTPLLAAVGGIALVVVGASAMNGDGAPHRQSADGQQMSGLLSPLLKQRRSTGSATPEYAIVIEKSPRNYSAYVPDLPGCVATGATKEHVVQMIRQAIELHIESLREQGEPVPAPQTRGASGSGEAL